MPDDPEPSNSEERQYKMICQPQLVRIEQTIDKVFALLDGPNGLVAKVERQDEKIASLRRGFMWFDAILGTVVGALVIAAIVAAVDILTKLNALHP